MSKSRFYVQKLTQDIRNGKYIIGTKAESAFLKLLHNHHEDLVMLFDGLEDSEIDFIESQVEIMLRKFKDSVRFLKLKVEDKKKADFASLLNQYMGDVYFQVDDFLSPPSYKEKTNVFLSGFQDILNELINRIHDGNYIRSATFKNQFFSSLRQVHLSLYTSLQLPINEAFMYGHSFFGSSPIIRDLNLQAASNVYFHALHALRNAKVSVVDYSEHVAEGRLNDFLALLNIFIDGMNNNLSEFYAGIDVRGLSMQAYVAGDGCVEDSRVFYEAFPVSYKLADLKKSFDESESFSSASAEEQEDAPKGSPISRSYSFSTLFQTTQNISIEYGGSLPEASYMGNVIVSRGQKSFIK